MSTIEVSNVGPIPELHISLPDAGGVVRLLGRNGSGKSTGLESVEALTGASRKLTHRDKSPCGQISGLGAALTIAARNRHAGEAEVTSLEGKLDLASLVNPGIKSDDAADAKRIKSLVSITGAKADVTRFYDLIGGREAFEEYVSARETEELVDLTSHVKREFEKAAREEESKADIESGHARASKEQADGVPLDCEVDSHTLQMAHTKAVEESSRLKESQRNYLEQKEQRKAAEREIEEHASKWDGGTVAEADDLLGDSGAGREQAVTDLGKKQVAAAKAEQELRDARHRLESKVNQHKACRTNLEAVKSHFASHRRFQEILKTDGLAPVSNEDIDGAEQAVVAAARAFEMGTRARDASAALENATAHRAAQAEHAGLAEKLRNAARSTDGVLSEAIECDLLRVEGGRLMTDTESRGATYYADLSDGERWRIAVDIAVDRLTALGMETGSMLLVIPQVAWSELDPSNKLAIHEHAVLRGVTILTAEATLGDLRCEKFDSNESESGSLNATGEGNGEAN